MSVSGDFRNLTWVSEREWRLLIFNVSSLLTHSLTLTHAASLTSISHSVSWAELSLAKLSGACLIGAELSRIRKPMNTILNERKWTLRAKFLFMKRRTSPKCRSGGDKIWCSGALDRINASKFGSATRKGCANIHYILFPIPMRVLSLTRSFIPKSTSGVDLAWAS